MAAGFTLVELLVVIAIIGTLFFTVAPRLDEGLFRDHSETTVNWIIQNTQRFRKKAVADHQNYYFSYDGSTHAFVIAEKSPGSEGKETYGKKTVKAEFSLPDSVFFNNMQSASGKPDGNKLQHLTFSKRGYVEPGTIFISNTSGDRYECRVQAFLHRVVIRKL